MKKYLLFLFLAASAAFTSCDTSDDQPVMPINNPVITTPADTTPRITYVVAKSWRITSFLQGAPGSTVHTELIGSGFPNCQKDDVYKFEEPSKMTVSTGSTKCDPSETDKTGTWNLNNNSTFFTLNNPAQTFTGLNGEFAVVEITATKIMITQVLNGSQYTITFTAI